MVNIFKFLKRIYYKRIFKEINNANDIILKAKTWQEIDFNYETRPPFIWNKEMPRLNLLDDYLKCVNKSFVANEKVKELKIKHFKNIDDNKLIDLTKGTCDCCMENKNSWDWKPTKYTIDINNKKLEFCEDCLLEFYNSLSSEVKK